MKAIPINDRLDAGYQVDSQTGCWVWQKSLTTSGYGKIATRENGRYRWWATHRLMYERYVGPIPEGLVTDHLCRNRACCNPEHLEPVTQRENLLRAETLQAANIVKTHCKFGHPFSPENTRIIPRGRRCIACEGRRARESYLRKKARAAADGAA